MLSITKNQMMIEHYREVLQVSETNVHIRMPDADLTIQGIQLHVLALEKDELLLEGTFQQLTFQYAE